MALGLLSILQRLSSVISCGGVYGGHCHCWLVACMTGIACLATPARPLPWLLLPTLRAIMTATGMADCIGEQQPAASTVCDDCLGRDMRKRRKGTRHHLDCQTAAKCKKLKRTKTKDKGDKKAEDKGRAGHGAWNPGCSSATETGHGAVVDLCVRWSLGGPLGCDIISLGGQGDLLRLASRMGFRRFKALSRRPVVPLACVPAVAVPEFVGLRRLLTWPLTALLLHGCVWNPRGSDGSCASMFLMHLCKALLTFGTLTLDDLFGLTTPHTRAVCKMTALCGQRQPGLWVF